MTISGGSGLFGEVRIPGAKNSVLPIMAASVLCRGTVTLTDVPHLSDVGASARILQSVGCKVLLENGRAVITPPEFPGSAVPEPLMRAMRSSLFYLAPLLARTGRADIYTPGGCRLGARPIDMHLSGLEKMGAHITEKDGGALEVTAPLLDEAERAVVRRGKNSTKATVAKHATPQEYRASTALESLFGWLYLQNRGARIEELFDVIWNALAPGFALQAE